MYGLNILCILPIAYGFVRPSLFQNHFFVSTFRHINYLESSKNLKKHYHISYRLLIHEKIMQFSKSSSVNSYNVTEISPATKMTNKPTSRKKTSSKKIKGEQNEVPLAAAKVIIDFFEDEAAPKEGELLGPISFDIPNPKETFISVAEAREGKKQIKGRTMGESQEGVDSVATVTIKQEVVKEGRAEKSKHKKRNRRKRVKQEIIKETKNDVDSAGMMTIKQEDVKEAKAENIEQRKGTRRKRAKKEIKEKIEEEVDHVSFQNPNTVKVEVKIKKLPKIEKKALKNAALKKDFENPSHEDFESLYQTLVAQYGKPKLQRSGDSASACGRKQTVVDACMAIILSQNTSNTNSRRALAALKEAYPGGAPQILQSTPEELAKVIKAGGLANVKSKRIFDLLCQLKSTTGSLSLEHLRELPTDEVKMQLGRFKGLGPKSISCILAFTLDREDLAVDTHVHRVSNRLGLVPQGSSREKVYDYLGESCPSQLKQQLHVLLIRHGQQVCKAQAPKCANCYLANTCPSLEQNTDLYHSKQKQLLDW